MAQGRTRRDGIESRAERRRGGLITVVIAVVLFAGCGAQAETVDGSVKHEWTGAVASERNRALDLGAIKESVEAERFLHVRSEVELSMGATVQKLAEFDVIVDTEAESMSMLFAANPDQGVPGYEMRMVGSTVYVRSDSADQWTKLVLDPSLTENDVAPVAQSGLLDQLEAMGAELRPDGTEDSNGVTYERFSGDLDWNEFVDTLRSANEFASQGFSQIPDDADVEGSASALLDEHGAPHRLVLEMEISFEGEQARTTSTSTYENTDGITGIDEPTADQVADTVQVHSADDYQRALEDVLSGH